MGMTSPPTSAAQLLSLVQRHVALASTLKSMPEGDVGSFIFSFWLGVSVLQRDHPCSPEVVGRFGQLLSNVLRSSSGCLGFIDACSELRLACMMSGQFSAELIKTHKRQWVGSIVKALVCHYGGDPVAHSSASFASIVTFLGWLKRLPVFIRPECESIQAYKQCDERISSLSFGDDQCVERLRRIWFEWFRSFKLLPPFEPRHGSGSTADAGRVRAQKWAGLRSSNAARICLRYPSLEECELPPIDTVESVSKVVFVPKQAGKDRTICMEPAWLQYLQQGVAHQLVRFTHQRSHPLALLVNIFDQDVNRSLCAQAQWRGLATLDLSDASDSISVRLIKELTKGLRLWRYLYATRSRLTSIGGSTIECDKFAPMGSALCFPIESYLFASIVEDSYRRYYGQASKGHQSGCSVYGDDIIVPREINHLVVDTLEHLGFKVNEQKSFSSGRYFESCGVEYVNARRITTVRHPRRHLYCIKMASPDDVSMVTDIANSLLDFGALTTRRMLLLHWTTQKIRLGSKIKPFSDYLVYGSDGIRSLNPTVSKGSWNRKLQRFEKVVKVITAIPKSTQWDYVEFQHKTRESTRDQRLRRRMQLPKCLEPHERWSERGITYLLKMGHFALIQDGDVQEVRTSRTGRPRYKETHRAVSL